MAESIFGNFEFPNQVKHYTGKTREMFFTGDLVINIATKRLSAFNYVFDTEVPYKDAVLNLLAGHFLNATKKIVPNWYRKSPNTITSVGVAGDIIPYEIIVRGYLAGSAWRLYKDGGRTICGVSLPEGLKENDKLPSPIITPTRKSKDDEPITREEILAEGAVTELEYLLIENYVLALFSKGQRMAKKIGLILVDTKYEFMFTKLGELLLADEVHTPDSSRYFYLEGYTERQQKGEKQKQLSKEFFREWLMNQGYGEKEAKEGMPVPIIPVEVISELSGRYINLYEMITQKKFPYNDADKTKDADFVYLSSVECLKKIKYRH